MLSRIAKAVLAVLTVCSLLAGIELRSQNAELIHLTRTLKTSCR